MEALSYRLVECTVGGVHGNSFVIAGGPPKLAQSSSSSVIERCGKYGRAYKRFCAAFKSTGILEGAAAARQRLASFLLLLTHSTTIYLQHTSQIALL